MNRSEHLAWCKTRALQYVDAGEVTNAYSSMTSDLMKHPETQNHSALQMGMLLLMGGHLSTPHQMREFINGFN